MLRVRRSIPTGCHGAIRSFDGCPLDRIALAFLRSRLDPGEALFGDGGVKQRLLASHFESTWQTSAEAQMSPHVVDVVADLVACREELP